MGIVNLFMARVVEINLSLFVILDFFFFLFFKSTLSS